MPTIKLVVTGAPGGFTTYGTLWRFPREPGDEPVKDSIVVRKTPTKLQLRSGWYQYYFTFTGQQDDDKFELSMKHEGSPSPAPVTSEFGTVPVGSRVFRFMV